MPARNAVRERPIGRTVSVFCSAVAAASMLVVVLTSGTTRFWAIFSFVIATLVAIVAIGMTVAASARRSGRRVFGALVIVSVPIVCLTLVYATVAAQAESVSTTEVVRNATVVLAVVVAALAISYRAGPQGPSDKTAVLPEIDR